MGFFDTWRIRVGGGAGEGFAISVDQPVGGTRGGVQIGGSGKPIFGSAMGTGSPADTGEGKPAFGLAQIGMILGGVLLLALVLK